MSKNNLFIAKLKGSNEVPPVDTNAEGLAQFKVTGNGKQIKYRLTVNNLNHFTAAHIHIGKRGMNGPVLVLLFGPVDPSISVNEGTVEGTITQEDLTGPLAGRPLSFLLELMKNDKAYVNAHSEKYPEGEIRGPIKIFTEQ